MAPTTRSSSRSSMRPSRKTWRRRTPTTASSNTLARCTPSRTPRRPRSARNSTCRCATTPRPTRKRRPRRTSFSRQHSRSRAAAHAAPFYLIRVHAGLLDERAPFVDLALEVRLQRRGRRLVGRVGRRAEVGEALLHGVVLQRVLQRGDELVERGLRQALGRV